MIQHRSLITSMDSINVHSLTQDGEIYVQDVIEQVVTNHRETITAFKRAMGSWSFFKNL